MRLLIVDDNAVNLRLLRAQLEADEHEVIEAANGAAALALLRTEPVDGVVSDILMPQMDGYRLCLEVRKDPALRHLPLVLYTSTYNSPTDRQLASEIGADAYISKPAPTAMLLDAIRAASGRTALPDAHRLPQPDVMERYSRALVDKLEAKNLALEASLQEAQRADARYRLVFENSPSGIIMTSQNGEVLSANPAAARMLGYASVDEGLAALRGSARPVYADPQARDEYIRTLRRDGQVRNFEASLLRKDGQPIWASLSGRAILDPTNGSTLLVTMAVDITREKEQQQRIERLNRIKQMLVGIASAIVRHRERGALLSEACRIAVENGGFPSRGSRCWTRRVAT